MSIGIYAKWQNTHMLLFSIATCAALMPLYFLIKDIKSQVLFLLINVALLGICHGSLDHKKFILAGNRLSRLKTFGIFALGYLCLVCLILYAWLHDPSVTLISFLIISYIHFSMNESDNLSNLDKIIWGGVPIFSPCFLHEKKVNELFSVLTGSIISFSNPIASALQVIGFIFFALACVATVIGFFVALEQKNKGKLLNQIANIVFIIVYAVLPPLLSFALYFCWWHSLRECLRMIADFKPTRFVDGLLKFLKGAAPLTIGSWVIGILIFLWLKKQGQNVEEGQIATIFFLLSSLTVPHMLVSMFASRREEIV